MRYVILFLLSVTAAAWSAEAPPPILLGPVTAPGGQPPAAVPEAPAASGATVSAPPAGTGAQGAKAQDNTKTALPMQYAILPPPPINYPDPPAPSVRIKDVADVQGVRDNQLIGQSLVIGLDGTGDKTNQMTSQFLSNILSSLGVEIPAAQLKPKNVAVVIVTAQLPAYIKKGAKIDVQVSSIGDATTLQGGVLVQTPLKGADGRVYAVAQGAISVGGFVAGGGGGGGGSATITKNHTLVGRIPNGALVEREIETTFAQDGFVRISLKKSDFTTAERMAVAINKQFPESAKAIDPYTVAVCLNQCGAQADTDPLAIMAQLENVRFVPDMTACVVVNERTGTIVAGGDVRLSPTVLSHGSLVIMVKRTPVVFEPNAFSNTGKEVKTSDQTAGVDEKESLARLLAPPPTLADLAAALNALKMTPRDIIAIFQALKEAGALNAELRIM